MGPSSSLAPVGWVDAAMLGVVLLSVLVGAWRGLVFELLALVGWVVAWIAAQAFAAELAPQVPIGSRGSALNLGAAFVLLFVGVLIVWAIAARIVRWLLRASPLSAVDRVLGAAFGFVRGIVVLLVIATAVLLSPLAQSPAWRASSGAVWLHAMLRVVAPHLPPDFARRLPA